MKNHMTKKLSRAVEAFNDPSLSDDRVVLHLTLAAAYLEENVDITVEGPDAGLAQESLDLIEYLREFYGHEHLGALTMVDLATLHDFLNS